GAAAARNRPLPHARLLPVVRCHPFDRRDRRGDHRRDPGRAPVGTAGAADRSRRRHVDGEEEARGLLLMRPRLRLLTCGSVDDGKSTLIGRLLHDAGLIFTDQLDALRRDSRRHGTTGDALDFALLLDGLDAERQQGITIDVAYRYFSTPRRTFV